MTSRFHLHDESGAEDCAHDDEHDFNHGHLHPHAGPSARAGRRLSSRSLAQVTALTLVFAVVELLGGWWSGSLALLSDAGHMLTDSLSLLLALWVSHIGHRPANERLSFGHGRAEVLGALVNSLLLFGLSIVIVIEAASRLARPHPVNGLGLLWIAAAGLAVNALAAWLLSRGAHSLNSRAALWHVLGDLLGSVAAIASGAVIWRTGWLMVDPLLSILVALLLLAAAWRLIRQAGLVLMEGVPRHLDYNRIGAALAAIAGVRSVHDLHVWTMSAERVALSAHLRIAAPQDWPRILAACQRMLSRDFSIDHVTLQAEWPPAAPAGKPVPIDIVSEDKYP
ncbi:cation diffusion facilitator family transporter [Chromobacterium sp. IIBBL 290-4]|uniref:cation diffusion facilitator family transporter n=1 Tax=Chromobacterium sp. IIBBL 290-4 TaxID=2953890 RepID=UPI0020B89464|nr:cation diffusion facilitator family transporter [Chromobacterium sp. IIBBL 290-4]UTH72417.1 cation diffusion facilitator family transporter [Chromobacterium sp. IIBBL 290-4]